MRELVINSNVDNSSNYIGLEVGKQDILRSYVPYFNLIKLGIYTLLFILYACNDSTKAAQRYTWTEGEKIHALVSSKETNTINFGSCPITNIIGDEEKYQVIADDSHSNLFFKLGTNIAIGESIELSLTNSAHKVFNLILRAKDIEGQLIFIKDTEPAYRYELDREKEIANLLRAMIKDKNALGNKYFISKINRKISFPLNSAEASALNLSQGNYEVVQDRTYSYKDLIGARLIVTNKDNKMPIILEKSNFDKIFDRTLAVSIEHNALLPGSGSKSIPHSNAKSKKSYVFIVAENKE